MFVLMFTCSLILILLDYLNRLKILNTDQDLAYLSILGYTLLFLTGASTTILGLDYRSSQTLNTTYSYTGTSINSTTLTITDNYTPMTYYVVPLVRMNHILGFILATVGGIGLFLTFMNLRKED